MEPFGLGFSGEGIQPIPPIEPIPAIPKDKDKEPPSENDKGKPDKQKEAPKGPDEPGKGEHIDDYA